MPLAAPVEAPLVSSRQVGTGVEAGDRVLREQEAERDDCEEEAEAAGHAAVGVAGVVDPLGEDVAEALVRVRDHDQQDAR